jgi:cyclic-di-GMP-binding biofilm dispersal mediator protein
MELPPQTSALPDQPSIIVVGATGVLGSAIARQLHTLGAKLTLVGRDTQRLNELVATLPGSVWVATDIRGANAGTNVCAQAMTTHGRIDGVINAAGIVAFGNLIDTEDDILEDLFLTNVLGPLWILRAALRHLPKGSFVCNISGVVAETPLPGMAAYAASKAALAAADVALSRELKRVGVRVLDARPPHTETGLAQRSVSGTPPSMPTGLNPEHVAKRIVTAIVTGEADLPSSAFA